MYLFELYHKNLNSGNEKNHIEIDEILKSTEDIKMTKMKKNT